MKRNMKNKILEMDKKIAFWFASKYHHRVINWVLKTISNSGDFGLIWLVIITGTTLFSDIHQIAQRMLFALLAATFLGQMLIKSFVQRERPCQQYPMIPMIVPKPTDSSFPSGHTTASFACATVICFFEFPLGILAFVFAILMGISRLYLFVHYLSDVLMATLLGIGIGIIIMMF